ncbi:MAG: SurA N-terminal domain-containing protein [Verrucomicrobium sp.]|nr:SurA N-terminal domain-containing protein [Verrucomicrobium sp.]
MLTILRRQSPVLMAIILGLISLSFLVFFQLPTLQGLGHSTLGRIDGHGVGVDEFRQAQEGAYLLLMFQRGADLPGGEETTAVVDRMAWQRLLLLASAERMHIAVTDAELGDFIQSLPFLRKDGKYDPAAYDAFAKGLAASRGITEDRFQEILRENLLIDKVIQSVSAPAALTPGEVDRLVSSRLGAAHAVAVRFRAADFAGQVSVTLADADREAQDHEANPAYRTLERRVVAVAPFLLTPAEERLSGKEKDAAKRQLGARASEFSVAALDKAKGDPAAFRALAAAQKLSVTATQPFARSEAPAGFPPSLSFNRAAFDLTADVPVSDAVETDHGYYVLQLVRLEPSVPLPPEKSRLIAEKALRERRALELAQARGQALSAALRANLAAGQPWSTALEKAEKSLSPGPRPAVEALPAFVPVEAARKSGDFAFLNALTVSLSMAPGQVSPWVPTPEGGFLLFLEKRDPAASALAVSLRPQMERRALEDKREALFSDWFGARARQPGCKTPDFLTRRSAQ